jgi:hypothetical protein
MAFPNPHRETTAIHASMMASGWRVVSSTLPTLEEDHPGGTRSKAALSGGFRDN